MKPIITFFSIVLTLLPNVLPATENEPTQTAQQTEEAVQKAEEAAAEAEDKARIAANVASAEKLMPAADATAEQLIQALYKMPESSVAFGVYVPEYKSFSRRFLTTNLITLLEGDFNSGLEMPPTLDWDPCRSMDTDGTPIAEAKKVTIKAFEPTGDKVTVKATLQFADHNEVITFICGQEEAQWKIRDVKQEDGSTLVKALEESKKLRSETPP
jgi:hypothetical protein